MSDRVRADGVGADFGGMIRALIVLISDLNGESGIRGFSLMLTYNLLFNSFRKGTGVSGFVGDVV
jgi:hypothetical protein